MNLHTNNKVKIYISWDEFYQDTLALCQQIKNMNIKGLVVIARGGLIPAGILAYELNICKSDILELRSYDDNGFNQPIEINQLPKYALADKGKDWLIIDEILDSGSSMQQAKDLLPLAYTYTIYSKVKQKLPFLDGYVKYVPKTYWLCLPWSHKECN